MNQLARNLHPMPVLTFTLLALGVAGCTERNPRAAAYCDNQGCYQCDVEKNCWPVDNQKCSSDAQCASGTQCTTIGCAHPCKADADCGGGDLCITGFCAPSGFGTVSPYVPPAACSNDSGCKAEEFCNGGQCVPRCKSDDDCGPDSVCTACGKCEPKGVPATCGTTPSFCSDTTACGSGKTCIKNRCHLQCTSSAACAVGQVCSSGLCVDDPNPAAPECVVSLDCSGGACINGYCHAACTTSAECGTGALCQVGVCQPDYHPAQ